MKILHIHIINADTCGGLLNGFNRSFHNAWMMEDTFAPLCLIGPNGAGKSQLLQVLAEIFQAAFHDCVPSEERRPANPDLQFEVEYVIRPEGEESPVHVRLSRQMTGRGKPTTIIETKFDGEWTNHELNNSSCFGSA